jgi:hypothetical protein
VKPAKSRISFGNILIEGDLVKWSEEKNSRCFYSFLGKATPKNRHKGRRRTTGCRRLLEAPAGSFKELKDSPQSQVYRLKTTSTRKREKARKLKDRSSLEAMKLYK